MSNMGMLYRCLVSMVYSLSIITACYLYERSIPCRKLSTILAMLTQNLISKTCAKVYDFLQQIITSPDFIARNRQHPKDFTRQRKLPFHVLITFLINFVRGSYQDELDKFFKTICRFELPKRVVSKVALTSDVHTHHLPPDERFSVFSPAPH